MEVWVCLAWLGEGVDIVNIEITFNFVDHGAGLSSIGVKDRADSKVAD